GAHRACSPSRQLAAANLGAVRSDHVDRDVARNARVAALEPGTQTPDAAIREGIGRVATEGTLPGVYIAFEFVRNEEGGRRECKHDEQHDRCRDREKETPVEWRAGRAQRQ